MYNYNFATMGQYLRDAPPLEELAQTPWSRITNYGTVPSLTQFSNSVADRHGIDLPQNHDGTLGLYLGVSNGGTLEQYIARHNHHDHRMNLFAEGHEYGHAMHHNGTLGRLGEQFSKYGLEGMVRNYRPYAGSTERTREDYAHDAGIYNLLRNGVDIDNFARSYVHEGSPMMMREAFSRYFTARQKKEGKPSEVKHSTPIRHPTVSESYVPLDACLRLMDVFAQLLSHYRFA